MCQAFAKSWLCGSEHTRQSPCLLEVTVSEMRSWTLNKNLFLFHVTRVLRGLQGAIETHRKGPSFNLAWGVEVTRVVPLHENSRELGRFIPEPQVLLGQCRDRRMNIRLVGFCMLSLLVSWLGFLGCSGGEFYCYILFCSVVHDSCPEISGVFHDVVVASIVSGGHHPSSGLCLSVTWRP